MTSEDERRVELEQVMYRVLSDGEPGIRFYDLVGRVRQRTGERLSVATLRSVLHDLLADGIVERVAHGTYRVAPLIEIVDASV